MAQRLSQLNSVLTNYIHSRLHHIRQTTKLNTEQLKDLLYSPGSYNKYIKPVFEYIDQNRHIFSHPNIESHSLAQQRKEGLKMALTLSKQFKIDLVNESLALPYIRYASVAFDLGVNTRSSVHYMLYTNSLILFSSNSKHKQFIQRATKLEDLGCFGLTQFHHGSYTKGIETQAQYDHNTKEFILTTQGTKGMKFWIGSAAEVANMSVIWAQLIINGQSQGPHPFVLPIRNSKTHKVLPGIIIGDIGPKNGANSVDNGYIILNDVRIPLQNLLGRFGRVDESGTYKSPISSKDQRFGVHMSALSSGRGSISLGINSLGINATTIALRYSCIRKQFETKQKNDEITIIDYPITKFRLIPHIARLILQIATGNSLARIYFGSQKLFLTDKEFGAELHAISSSVKVMISSNVAAIVAGCRTILGGHGYSAFSRIPQLIHSADVNCTWEGDNTVLLQQTSKYLMKVIDKKIKTKILDLSFIHNPSKVELQKIEEKLRDINNVELLLQDLLRTKYTNARQKVSELKKLHSDKEESQYHFHPQAGNSLSLTFADYYTFTVAKAKVLESKCTEVRRFLEDCLFLWAFVVLEKERYGSHDFRIALQKEIMGLCDELVDRSVVVTDALAPSSFVIGSPFADFYGDGFKEYINILYTKKETFARSNYYQDIKTALLS